MRQRTDTSSSSLSSNCQTWWSQYIARLQYDDQRKPIHEHVNWFFGEIHLQKHIVVYILWINRSINQQRFSLAFALFSHFVSFRRILPPKVQKRLSFTQEVVDGTASLPSDPESIFLVTTGALLIRLVYIILRILLIWLLWHWDHFFRPISLDYSSFVFCSVEYKP